MNVGEGCMDVRIAGRVESVSNRFGEGVSVVLLFSLRVLWVYIES